MYKNAVSLLKADPSTFLSVGVLVGFKTYISKQKLIPERLNVYSIKWIPYMMFKNAAGTYSMTRLVQKELGETHPITALTYEGLSKYYYEMEDFQNAFIYIVKTINIRMTIFPSNYSGLIDAKKRLREIKEKMNIEKVK